MMMPLPRSGKVHVARAEFRARVLARLATLHYQLGNAAEGDRLCAEVLALANRHWALAYNDTERGRHSLAVSLSEDEGKSWKWTRHLEYNAPGPDATHAAYPSIIQARDGTLHVSYTYTVHGKHARRDADPGARCWKTRVSPGGGAFAAGSSMRN